MIVVGQLPVYMRIGPSGERRIGMAVVNPGGEVDINFVENGIAELLQVAIGRCGDLAGESEPPA